MTYAAFRAALIAGIASVALSACATPPTTQSATDPENPLSWLAGCWKTESGAFREVWAVDGPQHLFGYNTFRHPSDPGTIAFFEQMRLMETDGVWTFSAYPNGVGPSDFPRTASGPFLAEFTNAAHDFPQRITYQREGDTLNAEVSTLDGEQTESWVFLPCDP